jgi:hypothetical protein
VWLDCLCNGGGLNQFYERVKNLSSKTQPRRAKSTQLRNELQYRKTTQGIHCHPSSRNRTSNQTTGRKTAKHIPSTSDKKLKQIINPNNQANIRQKRQPYIMKELNKKLNKENAILTQADKGKTIVIINSEDYAKKCTNSLQIITSIP